MQKVTCYYFSKRSAYKLCEDTLQGHCLLCALTTCVLVLFSSRTSMKRMRFTSLTTWTSPSITTWWSTNNLELGWLLLRLTQKGNEGLMRAERVWLKCSNVTQIFYMWANGSGSVSWSRINLLPSSLCSYENLNDDAPDCSGGAKFLKNKHTGTFKIPYTYSVSFVVSIIILLFISVSVSICDISSIKKSNNIFPLQSQ